MLVMVMVIVEMPMGMCVVMLVKVTVGVVMLMQVLPMLTLTVMLMTLILMLMATVMLMLLPMLVMLLLLLLPLLLLLLLLLPPLAHGKTVCVTHSLAYLMQSMKFSQRFPLNSRPPTTTSIRLFYPIILTTLPSSSRNAQHVTLASLPHPATLSSITWISCSMVSTPLHMQLLMVMLMVIVMVVMLIPLPPRASLPPTALWHA